LKILTYKQYVISLYLKKINPELDVNQYHEN